MVVFVDRLQRSRFGLFASGLPHDKRLRSLPLMRWRACLARANGLREDLIWFACALEDLINEFVPNCASGVKAVFTLMHIEPRSLPERLFSCDLEPSRYQLMHERNDTRLLYDDSPTAPTERIVT